MVTGGDELAVVAMGSAAPAMLAMMLVSTQQPESFQALPTKLAATAPMSEGSACPAMWLAGSAAFAVAGLTVVRLALQMKLETLPLRSALL